jgi:hypothetical protein
VCTPSITSSNQSMDQPNTHTYTSILALSSWIYRSNTLSSSFHPQEVITYFDLSITPKVSYRPGAFRGIVIPPIRATASPGPSITTTAIHRLIMGFLDCLLCCLCPCLAYRRRQGDAAGEASYDLDDLDPLPAQEDGYKGGEEGVTFHPLERDTWRTVKPSPTPKPVSIPHIT